MIYITKLVPRDENGNLNINPFTMDGILPEIIISGASIIFYVTMIIILEAKAKRVT